MPEWLTTLVLVTARIAALVTLVPGIQGQYIPWRIRICLIGLLSVATLCIIPPVQGPVAEHRLVPLILQEASLGLSLALVPAALVFGLQLAAESLLGMTGLAADGSASPLPGNMIARFFLIVSLSVFFATSGHRHVFRALLDSFYWMPVGSASPLLTTKAVMLDVLQQSFQLGTRAMAPIASALAIGILALAAINRVIPQLGYFAVGMSVQTTVLLASIIILMGSVGLILEAGFETGLQGWHDAWMAHGNRGTP